MIAAAAILDTRTLGKVILYALIAGVGVTVVFALGVSSAAGLVDAVRQRRTLAGALWGVTAALCLAASLGAMVLGVAVMASK
jgi:predicted MFS family arabinose efflux permease